MRARCLSSTVMVRLVSFLAFRDVHTTQIELSKSSPILFLFLDLRSGKIENILSGSAFECGRYLTIFNNDVKIGNRRSFWGFSCLQMSIHISSKDIWDHVSLCNWEVPKYKKSHSFCKASVLKMPNLLATAMRFSKVKSRSLLKKTLFGLKIVNCFRRRSS